MSAPALKSLEKDFEISKTGMKSIIKSFHLEMDKGLSGKPGSLKMIPAYVSRPTGNEKGKYIALDLGGTNFRILSLELKGHGAFSSPHVMKFALRKKDITSTGKKLFQFIARSIKKFLKEEGIARGRNLSLGFTFSFPVKQVGIDSGALVVWTKGFSASGVEGRDVVSLLKRALEEEKIGNISVTALANDTVGTLASGSYGDRTCDVGVIIGTGTNACYVEKLGRIKKLKGRWAKSGTMIINMEWGNFNALKATRYDRRLDRESDNPLSQILEKMVSGMYLGEICRLVMMDLAGKKILFGGRIPKRLKERMFFKGEFISQVLGDRSSDLAAVEALLRGSGVLHSTKEDRRIVKSICGIVSVRAARISAAAMAAVLAKRDPRFREKHTIAIDGSVYEKLPGFSGNVKKAIRELCGPRSSNIRIVLTKDGSGRGAAIIAAVAASGG